MTPIENLFNAILVLDIWGVVKIFILLALVLYIAFAVVVAREVDLMNRTLKGVFNLPIRIVSLLHLILAIFVFILAIIIL